MVFTYTESGAFKVLGWLVASGHNMCRLQCRVAERATASDEKIHDLLGTT